jgi:hypothetical protein
MKKLLVLLFSLQLLFFACDDFKSHKDNTDPQQSVNENNEEASFAIQKKVQTYTNGRSSDMVASDLNGKRIALKSMANNKFVCAENAGNNQLIANRDVINTWELFYVEHRGSNIIALKSFINNKYVCADNLFPGAHKFEYQIPETYLNGNSYQLYAYAINNVSGNNPHLNADPYIFNAYKRQPEGYVDEITNKYIGGWAKDPDTNEPLDIHVYVYDRNEYKSGSGATPVLTFTSIANLPRADLSTNSAYHIENAAYKSLGDGEYVVVVFALGKNDAGQNDGQNVPLKMSLIGTEVGADQQEIKIDTFANGQYKVFSQYLGIIWDEPNNYDMYQSAVRLPNGEVYCYYTKNGQAGSLGESVFLRKSNNGISGWTDPQLTIASAAGQKDSDLLADGNVMAVCEGDDYRFWMFYTGAPVYYYDYIADGNSNYENDKAECDNLESDALINQCKYVKFGIENKKKVDGIFNNLFSSTSTRVDSDFSQFHKLGQFSAIDYANGESVEPLIEPYGWPGDLMDPIDSYPNMYGTGQPSIIKGHDNKYHLYFTDSSVGLSSYGFEVIYIDADNINDFWLYDESNNNSNFLPAPMTYQSTSDFTYYTNLGKYAAYRAEEHSNPEGLDNDIKVYLGNDAKTFIDDPGYIIYDHTNNNRNFIKEGGLLRDLYGQITQDENMTIIYYGAGNSTSANDFNSIGSAASRVYIYEVL